MTDEIDFPDIEPEQYDDYSDDQAQIKAYFDEQIARHNVVSIKDGKEIGPDDRELIPLDASDIIYESLIFDARQSLIDSSNQNWLIDGIIPEDGLGALYGPSGSYKSFLALSLAASIATGEKWNGYEVDSPGPVLYVAAEGARGLKERTVAWEIYNKNTYGQLVILPMAIMMDEALHVQSFVEAAIKAQDKIGKPFKFVVIDTMARSFNGDENSVQDTSRFINSCSAWRSKLEGPTVMIVTHSGKDLSRGIRGSSAIKGACDFVFQVTRPDDLQALLKNEKQKDIEEAPDMRFSMQTVPLGINDYKGRALKSLVAILESVGANADPENQEDEGVFKVMELRSLIRIVSATNINGEQITEDQLRDEYIKQRESEGVTRNGALKTFRRNLAKAKEQSYLIKHGKFISVGENNL